MTTATLLYLFLSFVAGYVVARLDAIYSTLRGKESGGGAFLMASSAAASRNTRAQEQKAAEDRIARVSIDTTTVVTPVKTDGMKKVSTAEIGSVTKQNDTLNSSVSKLAQLKR